MADSDIAVRGLRKSFRGHEVLKGVDLDIAPRELTAIIGRSGCGKSTLLRCLNGLETFDAGSVRCGGVTLEHRGGARQFEADARVLRRRLGMVFQSFNLFPHMTVLENLTVAPVVVQKQERAAAEKTARALLEKVGLSTHAAHYPAQLSGGQQQRSAIARALALAPSVMLYDEPTSALDPWLVDEVFAVMRTLASEGMTQVIVTHEMRFVREVARKIVYMEDGVVMETGTPEQLFRSPRDERTKKYLSRFVE
jgi:polar amino acid transport system ATP-binding protein